MQTVSMVLAEFASGLGFDSLPCDVVEKAKRCLLDFVGVAVGGRGCPLLPVLLDVACDEGTSRRASIIGQGTRTSLLGAPLVNGTMGHFLELDDGHKPSISHPGTVVIPAALAVAEMINASGKDLLLSIVLGYDIVCRIGTSIQPSHQAKRGFHTTGTCGTFGAAVAAAKLLGLTSEETAYAIGLAGLQACGLLEVMNNGGMSKPFQAGKAAHNGVMAALMAERGVRSPLTIFEGEKGFISATADDWKRDAVTEGLGERYLIRDIYFKFHAACGLVHSAIDAIVFIMKNNGLAPQDVKEIVLKVQTYAAEVVGKHYIPETPEQARFSLPYSAAVAVLEGRAGIEQYTAEKTRDPAILDMAQRVRIVADPTLDATFPNARSTVAKIITRYGEEYEKRVDAAKGHPENPPTEEEMKEKFMSLAAPHYGSDRAHRIAEIIGRIDNLDTATLASALRGESA